ncbi:DUF1269 domain-containing protein [Vagococcus acidifermentans]|uniref:DUF1269 domain-containing protein n=1 Tax=Vagococcus acidifermentans TaxID=564710 RepID=A0A430AVN4_9ENTE|nr:DUF1269 domain-containing protein [Vagococcus acidifermentans]RSU12106.1 DUF1269 domain-containing protein [Vagococcus acidifermentans]
MTKKVLIINFDMESLSYQAFSEIKKLHAQRAIVGEQMAIIHQKNDNSHQFEIKDFIDFTGNNHTAKDSTIGMLVGILMGPLGLLLGWFAGSMIGSYRDAKEIRTANSVFEHLVKNICPGQTGVILIAEEEDNRPLNHIIFDNLGGHIVRLDYDDVASEMSDAKEIEESACNQAQQKWSDRQQLKR